MSTPNPPVERDQLVKRSELAILYLVKVDDWLSKEKNKKHKDYHGFTVVRKALSCSSTCPSLKALIRLQTVLENHFNHRVIDNIDLTADDDDDGDERSLNGCTSNSLPFSAIKVEDAPSRAHPVAAASPVEADIPPIVSSPGPSSANTTHQPEVVLKFDAHQKAIDLEVEPPALEASLPPLPPIEDLMDSPFSASENVNPNPNVMKKVLVRRDSVYDPSTPKPNVPSISTYKIKTQPLLAPSVYAKPTNLEGGARKIITVPYKKEPRAREPAFDPKLESVRLAGIKEKIYAKDFLQFDAAKKEEMQREYLEKKAAEEAERAAEVDENEESEDDDEAPPVPKKRRRQSVAAKPESPKQPKRERRNSTAKQVSSNKGRARSRSCEKSKKVQTRSRSPSRVIRFEKSPSLSRDNCRVNRVESDDEDNYEVPDHVYDNIEHEMSLLMGGSSSNGTNFVNKPQQAKDENANILSTLSFLAEHDEVQNKDPEPIATTSEAALQTVPICFSRARMTRSKSVAQASPEPSATTSSEESTLEAAFPTTQKCFSTARMTRSKSLAQASKAKIYSFSSSSSSSSNDDDVAPMRIIPIIRSPLDDKTPDDQTDDAIEVLDRAKNTKKKPPIKKKPGPTKLNLYKPARGKGKRRGPGRPRAVTNIVPQQVTTHFEAADFEACENVSDGFEAADDVANDSNDDSLLVEVPGKQTKIIRRDILVPKRQKPPQRRNAIDENIFKIKTEPE